MVQPARNAYGGFRGGWATKRVEYSHDLFMDETLKWIGSHREEPFFLYLALTIPHANNEAAGGVGNGSEVPDYGVYADKYWPDPDKGQAAMITYMDRDIGRLVGSLLFLRQDVHPAGRTVKRSYSLEQVYESCRLPRSEQPLFTPGVPRFHSE